MKLELKHLSPYLPYKLEGIFTIYDSIHTVTSLSLIYINRELEYRHFKPILRPLSDLENEIEVNGEKLVPIEWLEDKYYTLDLHKQCKRLLEEDGENWINQCDYMLVEQLLEWHFDIFCLIENELAININTLKQ